MSAQRIAWGLGAGLLSCSLLACAAELAGSGSGSEPLDADALDPADASTSQDGQAELPRDDPDAAAGDATQLDAGEPDGQLEQPDASLAEDASFEAGGSDAGTLDASFSDASFSDAGLSDASFSDAGDASTGGPLDGGQPDATTVDAAVCTRGPVDLVWAIDGSTSMLGEIAQISGQLVRLIGTLQAAGADVRMTVLSPFDPVALTPGQPPSAYRFVMADIQKDNPLSGLLSNFSSYGEWLRPGVRTDLLVASDEDSSLAVGNFRNQMQMLLGHPFTFHAIAAPSSVFGVCSTAEVAGAHYEALTNQTGGLFLSICTTDWTGTFDQLAAAVLADAPLTCQ